MVKRMVGVLVLASLVVGGSAFAYAQAQPDDPAPAQGQAPAGAPNRWARCRAAAQTDEQNEAADPRLRRLCRRHALLARTVHADLVVKAGEGFRNLTFDRGEVTAVSDTSITLHRPDGVDVTVALTANTRYRGVDGPGAIETGKPAVVLAGDGSALVVGQRDGNYPEPSGVDGIGDQVPAA